MAIKQYSSVVGSQPIMTEFTSSGTWTHPEPGVPYVIYVELIGGGGGGGSGCVHQAASAMGLTLYGGNGGEMGQVHRTSLTVTENQSVIVGAGGSGAAARSITAPQTTQGNVGGTGGYSAFGRIRAPGGAGGAAGLDSGTGGAAPSVSGSSNPTIHVKHRTPVNNRELRVVGYNGSRGSDLSSGGYSAGAGGGNACMSGTAGRKNGGSGVVVSNSAVSVSGNAGPAADTGDYGASGAGGGAVAHYNASTNRTVASGAGGNGAKGVVRVWAWRAE